MRNDFTDEITLEIPDFRARAQHLLHLISGGEIGNPREYAQKLEMIEQGLREIYQMASDNVNKKLEHEFLSRPTKKPPPPVRAAPTPVGGWKVEDE